MFRAAICYSGVALIVGGFCFDSSVVYAQDDTSEESSAKPETEGLNAEGAAQGVESMDEIESGIVNISAAESAQHHLPAVSISLNTGDLYMSGIKFLAKNQYFSLSGPPGGPLGLEMTHVSRVPAEDAAWKDYLVQHYEDRSPVIGHTGTLEFAGGSRNVATCSTDGGPARSHHFLVVFPLKDHEGGVMLDFFFGADDSSTPKPDEILKNPEYSGLLNSIAVTQE